MSKYLRIPFDEDDCERIEEELSLREQKEAIVHAFNEKVDSEDEDEDEDEDDLAQYDRMRDVKNDDSISPEERKRRVIRARRRGLPR